MKNLTEREETILQKLIRHEKEANGSLPFPSEEYQRDLDVLYKKVSKVDRWEDY
jgi:Tfp pilus assembly PilM family ATPase